MYDMTRGIRTAANLSRELGNKEFNSNDTRGPKSVSAFIVKLSELAPRLIIKQMTLLAKQLDSEVRHPTRILPLLIFFNNQLTSW